MSDVNLAVYIHDLDISDKAKSFLIHARIVKLEDLMRLDINEISLMRGITKDICREIEGVLNNEEEVKKHFDRRKKRIAEIYPSVKDTPIGDLGLGTRAYNSLRRSGIHTVGALIQMSKRDIMNLSCVGVLTREEIVKAIENIIRIGKMELLPCFKAPAPDPRIALVLPEIENLSIENIRFSVRAHNVLTKANIKRADELVNLSENDILSFPSSGEQTKNEIMTVINDILNEGKNYFDNIENGTDKEANEHNKSDKGFDFAVIDILSHHFGFKLSKMVDWFGLSRQSIYNAIENRFPSRSANWTGKTMSEREMEVLSDLIKTKNFEYMDDKMVCYCMNNKQDDFVCLFVYEDKIKCFFLKDIPEILRQKIIDIKMHIYTIHELAGESDGQIVHMLTKPFYKPNNVERFRANAQLRGMTSDEYAVFLSGYPYADQRGFNDDQIVEFMKENMIDGKVSIKNQWIRAIASRNGYTLNEFIKLYGFEPLLNSVQLNDDEAKERHVEELKRYIISDNIVYFPTDSKIYRMLYTYSYKCGIDMNSYIRSLGFERTNERPDTAVDTMEKDMEVRESDGTVEEKIFAMYPLIGSRILKQETVDKLNANARKYIDLVLREPRTKLTLRAEMQITLALINHAKNWKSEENGNFWNYISLQFGYRDANGIVVKLLQASLENAMKQNRRLFLEDANGRAFKSTVVVHALSTRKSWMALFDFLFDFYKNNLNWNVIPNDPIIAVMIQSLRQKLSGENEENSELTISSKVYSFQEGIRKLVIYRPVYTRELFERLICKIDALINSDVKPAKTYEELLCEEWFKEKITAIANTKKAERQVQAVKRDVAIDYTRIRAKYLLKNETDIQLLLPDIRLKNGDISTATLFVYCDGTSVIQQSLSWYGNELGRTLNGIAVSIPSVQNNKINLQLRIVCDDEIIYDSEDNMNREYLIFYGSKEIAPSQIRRERYTLVIPNTTSIETENIDVVEIDSLKNSGLKAYFLDLEKGYLIKLNGHLLAFDSESGTEIRVIAPKESDNLPSVTLQDKEAYFAYRNSTCTIILGNSDGLKQFIVLKNGEKIEFDDLLEYENGLALTIPLNDDESMIQLKIINIADERLMFDKTFILIENAQCYFNREFYFSDSDYNNAEYCLNIDEIREVIPFTKEDTDIRIPFRDGKLHVAIPKVEIHETSGEWMQESQFSWFISRIPQNSLLKVTTPAKVEANFTIAGKDVQYDGQGIVAIGNVLQSFSEPDIYADIKMNIAGQKQESSYALARVYFKERFLKNPEFWFEKHKLFWDHGGSFIGNEEKLFTLELTSCDEEKYEFKMDENIEYITIPEEMPIGNYRYEISILTGTLFKRNKEVIAIGDCVIGDKNLLRFMNRKIVLEHITDESNEEAGHIQIRPCCIDNITFCGIEDTSEGFNPVYSGVLYSQGKDGERYVFSFDVHTNKNGITKMMVNPVRIVYISDTLLCITDSEGDGLYYYNYYDRETESVVYALTDYEYTKANKHKYSNADLYSYRIERM